MRMHGLRITQVTGDSVVVLKNDVRSRKCNQSWSPLVLGVVKDVVDLDDAVGGVLELEVACRHIGVGASIPGLGQVPVLDVPLVHDHEAEGVEQRFLEAAVEPVGVVARKQPHLTRELEVEEGDPAVAAAARGVGHDRTRGDLLEGMSSVDSTDPGMGAAAG